MSGAATIRDFKDLPKIMGPALLKAEPKPVTAPPTDTPPGPQTQESDADIIKRLGLSPDAVAAPTTPPPPKESDADIMQRLGLTPDPVK
jgi:hypothetical protein